MTTLYLKYRPQTIDDLDLENVRKTLTSMVKSGSIPHALLFTGPRGSGKTSAARIVAKIINCESKDKKKRGGDLTNPCNECEQCRSITKGTNIDVVEMDAASHRGIDDVRTLRDAVKLSPAKADKKIYIIDEAHMLTTEASNALLKTLEEPPDHVLFILATTNPEKLIETIRSRTTVVSFTKATIDEVVGSLDKTVGKENIKIDKNSLIEIAKVSDGSFRDAKKILEQLVHEGIAADEKKVIEFLQKNTLFDLDKFFENLSQKKASESITLIENAVNQGLPIQSLNEKIMNRIHLAILHKSGVEGVDLTGFGKADLIKLTQIISEKLQYQTYCPVEQLPLELATLKWCDGADTKDSSHPSKKNHKTEYEIKKANQQDKLTQKSEKSTQANSDGGPKKSYNDESVIDTYDTISEKNVEINNSEGENFNEDLWIKLLSAIRPINPSTEALLRAAKPMKLDNEYLFLGVYYSFHKEKLESIQHKTLLEDTLENVVGKRLRIQCFLTEPPSKKKSDNFQVPEYVNKSSSQKKQQNGTSENSGYNFKESQGGEPGDSDVLLTEPDDEDIIKLAEDIFGK